MLEINEAIDAILDFCHSTDCAEVPITESAGRVLVEPVAAKVDVPPYDKAMMDGYAVRQRDYAKEQKLKVVGRLTAGEQFSGSIGDKEALQIMTGAPIPDGADCVVMFEHSSEFAEIGKNFDAQSNSQLPAFITIDEPPIPHQHILPRGSIVKAGEEILSSGKTMQPIDIGLAIDTGISTVKVTKRPVVAVLATGDELVQPGEQLNPGQIFNSNSPMLAALLRQSGAEVSQLGIAQDKPDEMRRMVDEGLKADILVLTGGVSAGVLDLVPGILKEAGVEQVFHKVQLKPGKPVWFGVGKPKDNGRSNSKPLVFGLPGNPVSSFVCFHLFVLPAVRTLSGVAGSGHSERASLPESRGRLENDHLQRGPRTTYWPAIIIDNGNNNEVVIRPLAWRGSSDLRRISQANSLAIFPPGDHQFRAGDEIAFIRLPALQR